MDEDEITSPEVELAAPAALRAHLKKTFGEASGHPAGHVEDGDTCHLLLIILAFKELAPLPN